MASKKQAIAWECKHCGHRHMWKWAKEDPMESASIRMYCDKCDGSTWCQMRKLGRDVWAAVWN